MPLNIKPTLSTYHIRRAGTSCHGMAGEKLQQDQNLGIIKENYNKRDTVELPLQTSGAHQSNRDYRY